MRLGLIYHQCKFKDIALTRLARWYDEVDKSGFLTFGRVARSIQTHYLDIINFFERRATNAAAESFNAKIKAFRGLSRFLAGIIFYTREVLLTSHYEKRLFEHASQPRVACADIRLLSYLWSRTNLSRDSYQSG